MRPKCDLPYLQPYQSSLDIYAAITTSNKKLRNQEISWYASISNVLDKKYQSNTTAEIFDFLKECVGEMVSRLAKAHADIDSEVPRAAEANESSIFAGIPLAFYTALLAIN